MNLQPTTLTKQNNYRFIRVQQSEGNSDLTCINQTTDYVLGFQLKKLKSKT